MSYSRITDRANASYSKYSSSRSSSSSRYSSRRSRSSRGTRPTSGRRSTYDKAKGDKIIADLDKEINSGNYDAKTVARMKAVRDRTRSMYSSKSSYDKQMDKATGGRYSGRTPAYRNPTERASSNARSTTPTPQPTQNTRVQYVAKGTYNDADLPDADRAKIEAYKQQYAYYQQAGDTAGMQRAHAGAEAVRGKYNYSGGGDGSERIGMEVPRVEPNDNQRYVSQNEGVKRGLRDYSDNTRRNDTQNQDLMGEIKKQVTPEEYEKLLKMMMQTYQPTYDAQKADVMKQFQQASTNVEQDLEARGLTNSGIGTVQQRELSSEAQAVLQKYYADLVTKAAAGADKQADRALDSTKIRANMLDSERKDILSALNQEASMNFKQQEINQSQQQIDQKNLQFWAGLDQDERQFRTGLSEQARQFDQKYAEDIRQFNAGNLLANRKFDQDIAQFERSMGLKWSELSLAQKKNALDSSRQMLNYEITKGKYQMEQEKFAAQQAQTRLSALSGAYGELQQLMDNGASREEAQAYVSMYGNMPQTYGDIMSELNNAINAHYNKAPATGGGTGPINPATGLPTTYMDHWNSSIPSTNDWATLLERKRTTGSFFRTK